MPKLIDPEYMSFPFRVADSGVQTSRRREHIRAQIEQVLFTDPKERIFRPEFGAGVRTLVFEPNADPLWNTVEQRLSSTLAEVLRGEIDPATLHIEAKAEGGGEKLAINIAYHLATIGEPEQHQFLLGETSHG